LKRLDHPLAEIFEERCVRLVRIGYYSDLPERHDAWGKHGYGFGQPEWSALMGGLSRRWFDGQSHLMSSRRSEVAQLLAVRLPESCVKDRRRETRVTSDQDAAAD
jgi:hypothetical protein